MSHAHFDLGGQVALVTGASRGLGQAIAFALADAGAKICITARSMEGLEATRAQIAEQGGTCCAALQDVRDLASIEEALGRFHREVGAIDILVNNAGHEQVCPSTEVDEALWDRVVDTNLKGAFFWSRALVRHKRPGCPLSIVNLCSLTSFVGVPGAVPYGASKSGLLGMTRALATEWAPLGVRVNAIAPGYFRTAMTDPFYQNADWQSRMLEKIPQQRFGQPADIGGAVVFLCSAAAAYITGHCMPVDGGFLASI